jgi:hypothetical protein
MVMTDGIEFQEDVFNPSGSLSRGIVTSTHLQKSATDVASV